MSGIPANKNSSEAKDKLMDGITPQENDLNKIPSSESANDLGSSEPVRIAKEDDAPIEENNENNDNDNNNDDHGISNVTAKAEEQTTGDDDTDEFAEEENSLFGAVKPETNILLKKNI